MPIIQIEPLDTLFFRDGKPFNMGDETWAEGMFPPNPSVIWGALFSAFFEKEIREENLPNEDSLKIEKIYLYSGSKKELYLPSPLDLFCYEENKKEELVLAASYGLETISNKRAIYADNEIPVFQLENQFLNRTAFHNYFENFYGFEFELIKNENVFSKPNPKIGIKRDSKTRSSRDGNLYRVNMMEFDPEMDLKILVEISNEFIHAEKNKSGFLKLGGEGKVAHFKFLEKENNSNLFNQLEKIKNHNSKILSKCSNANSFKLFFNSPLVINEDLETFFNFDGYKVVTITTSKNIKIGGFSYKEKKPKPMLKTYPVGSVVLLESINKELPLIDYISKLNKKFGAFSDKGFCSYNLAMTNIIKQEGLK